MLNAASGNRLLFVSEAATLAHVARPDALARLLHGATEYSVMLACDRRTHGVLDGFPGDLLHLESQPSEQFVRALERGQPVFSLDTLRRYLRDDLELLNRVRPDAVIGDFRLTLAISARLLKIPYLCITNAYWSPYSQARFPVPDLPALTGWLPIPIAQALFDLTRSLAFALHAHPLERLLRENGQPGLGHDLRRVYTEADWVLYADIPETIALRELPQHHRFLGAIAWDPPCELPAWWHDLPTNLPTVYLTLGSSGRHGGLEIILEGLARLDVVVMLSTAGRQLSFPLPSNVFAAPYLPGSLASARAEVVVCNGGSPTTQQALVVGKPVLGICRNLDQFLNMQGIRQAGAGLLLRADRISPGNVTAAVARLVAERQFSQHAQELRLAYARLDAGRILRDTLHAALRGSGRQ